GAARRSRTGSDMTFSFGDEQGAQPSETARGRGLDRPGADVEGVRDLALGEVGVVAEDDALALARRELGEGDAQLVGERDVLGAVRLDHLRDGRREGLAPT